MIVAVVFATAGCVGPATQYGRSLDDNETATAAAEDPGNDPGDDAAAPDSYSGHPAAVIAGLGVGDCVRLDDTVDIAVRDCDLAHDGEVYHLADLDGERSDAELADVAAYHLCRAAFGDYVGVDYTETLLDFYPVWVSSDEWTGARPQIGCIVGDPEYRTVGPLADGDLLPIGTEPGFRVDGATSMSWDKLIAGDCIEEYTADYAETVVPCDQPHAIQVYGSGTLPDTTADDEESLADAATALCDDAYLAIPDDVDPSGFEFYDYYPDESTWVYGDRYVQCRAESLDGTVTGSILGPGDGLST